MLDVERSPRATLVRVLQTTARSVVAATCRVDASTVSKWAAGTARPSRVHRARLERFGVPVGSDWG